MVKVTPDHYYWYRIPSERKSEGGEETVAATEVLEFLRLDARSDPSLLDGLTLEHEPKLYADGTKVQPRNSANDP